MKSINKVLGMLYENRVVIIKVLVRDLTVGAMITGALYALLHLVSVDVRLPLIDVYSGITVLYVVLMTIVLMLKHDRESYGTIEKRDNMDDRVSAQIHEIAMGLSSILVVSAIFCAGLMYGLALSFSNYLLTAFMR